MRFGDDDERSLLDYHLGSTLDNRHVWSTRGPAPPSELKNLPSVVSHANPRKEPLVLFEAGEWAKEGLLHPPVEDPALIEHLVGDLWGVLFTWELTQLETQALLKAGVGLSD
jgi:hypothetical protein